jgi:hypothetical protein
MPMSMNLNSTQSKETGIFYPDSVMLDS